MYEIIQSTVRWPSGRDMWFYVTSGVRQGRLLSPLLFIVSRHRLLKTLEEHSHVGRNVTRDASACAGDVGSVAHSEEQLPTMLNI